LACITVLGEDFW